MAAAQPHVPVRLGTTSDAAISSALARRRHQYSSDAAPLVLNALMSSKVASWLADACDQGTDVWQRTDAQADLQASSHRPGHCRHQHQGRHGQ